MTAFVIAIVITIIAAWLIIKKLPTSDGIAAGWFVFTDHYCCLLS